MTPTQAQVDAAASALRKMWRINDDTQIKYLDEMAKAALTAAAEVGQSEAFLGGVAEGTFATIERCAKVAESFHAYDRPANEIAAAIRALKTHAQAQIDAAGYLMHCRSCGTLSDTGQCDCTKMKTGTRNAVPFTLADHHATNTATIERCAQEVQEVIDVADEVQVEALNVALRRIRALKDKP